MLKTKTIKIQHGRDKGTKFIITEMPVFQADNWAMKALFALMNSGSDFTQLDPQQGMAGVASVTFEALGKITPDVGIPLINELLDCVQIVPQDGKPRPINLEFGDVQDFTTLFLLRKEVFLLHTDFLLGVFGATTGSENPADNSTTQPT